MAKSNIGKIWQWSFHPNGVVMEYKVWISCNYPEIRAMIAGWKHTRKCATYFYSNGAVTWDYIIPTRYYNRVAKLIGIPPRKTNRTQKQLEHDKRLSEIGEKALRDYMRIRKSSAGDCFSGLLNQHATSHKTRLYRPKIKRSMTSDDAFQCIVKDRIR